MSTRDQLDFIFKNLDRSAAVCFPAGSSRLGRLKQDVRLIQFSPVATALSKLAEAVSTDGRIASPADLGWPLLDKAGSEDPACGAAIACFLGMALGDALGHPLEFVSVDASLPDMPDGRFSDRERPALLPAFDMDGQPRYQKECNKFFLRPGQWTDDTSMALCLADSLLVKKVYHGGDARLRWHMWWTQGYCNSFREDHSRPSHSSVGLGGNIAKSLIDTEYAAARSEAPEDAVSWTYRASNNDAGNGSIMRLAPVPVAFHLVPHLAMEVATLQSFATHPGPEAAACCCFMTFFIVEALLAHREKKDIASDHRTFMETAVASFLDQNCSSSKSRSSMYEFWLSDCTGQEEALGRLEALLRCAPPSEKEANWDWKRPQLAIAEALTARGMYDQYATYNGHPIIPGYFGAYCMDGLSMALWSLWTATSFYDCLFRVVNLLGDADTTASIAGQLAGAVFGWDGLRRDPRALSCIRNLERWDPLCEIGLRAALLFHCYPKQQVKVQQAEGHPAARVFGEPKPGVTPIGEIKSGEVAVLLDKVKHWCYLETASIKGWVGAKNVVEPVVNKPKGPTR